MPVGLHTPGPAWYTCPMPLWNRLYSTIWLTFFCCVLIPRWMGQYVGLPVHGLLGLGLVMLTLANARRLAAAPVPPRLQRVSGVTAKIAVFMLVCGLALGAVLHLAPRLPVVAPILRGLHVVCALTILSQVSSVATGYDMWEEKELGPAPVADPAKTDG